MSDNSLHAEPEKDHFKTESPIRAFTDWKVEGVYALGKGFRPALAHLVPYLNAMEEKEGWQLVQILEALTQHPSFVFRKTPKAHVVTLSVDLGTIQNQLTEAVDNLESDCKKIGLGLRQVSADMTEWWNDDPSTRDPIDGFVDRINGYALELGVNGCDARSDNRMKAMQRADLLINPDPPPIIDTETMVREMSESILDLTEEVLADPGALGPGSPMVTTSHDDPINPKHYNGRACADIGERLTANGYQILKYCWRLGGKDEECQELGKAVWYLDSEHALISQRSNHGWRKPDSRGLKPDKINSFLEDRIADQPRFVQDVARILWAGYNHQVLSALRARIVQEALHRQCNGNWSAL